MSRPVPLHRETHPNLDVPGCFGCKATGISFGTVPGAHKDNKRGTSYLRGRERALERYAEKRKAGEQPDGTTPEALAKYERKVATWERNEKAITDWNEPAKVKAAKRALLNRE